MSDTFDNFHPDDIERYAKRLDKISHEINYGDGCDVRQVATCLRSMFAAFARQNAALSDGCICKGNWRAIVKEAEPLIGKRFVDSEGAHWHLFGIVHGGDDYYYGMSGPEGPRLLSCVGSIKAHGFTEAP